MKNTLIRNIVKYVRSAAMLIAAIVIAVPASGQDIPDADGLFTKKYISSFDYDTMEGVLTLETFVTGEMKLVSTPVDVVFVLDHSGSMKKNKAGTDVGDDDTSSRMYNLKQASYSFIDQLYDIDHSGNFRIAIVEFSSNDNDLSKKLCDLTELKEDTKTSLKGYISGITSDGGTYMHKGLDIASGILTEDTKDSKRFVIVLTDGLPANDSQGTQHTTEQMYKEVSESIQKAFPIKNSLKSTKVYTIGLCIDSTKKITTWSDYKPQITIGDYLQRVSSKYLNVTDFKKKNGTQTSGNYEWDGTDPNVVNPDDATDNYCQFTDDPSQLSVIFKGIGAQIIGVAAKSLTAETVVKDIISVDCALPDGVKKEDVKVYSATCNGGDKTTGYTFGNKTDQSAVVQIIVDENTVNVTNFDFNANWVGLNSSTGQYQGKKLIVEIPFKVLPGALAGKDIKQLKTNGEKSGVYEKPSSEDPIKPFPVPEIDYIDLIIKATGLHADESALFKVERKMAGESEFSYFTTIALTGTSDEGTEVSSKILYQDPDATYKVTDLTGWSWTYAIQGATSLEKTSEEGQPIVFEFSNTKKENITIQNAEKIKDNMFSTSVTGAVTVTDPTNSIHKFNFK